MSVSGNWKPVNRKYPCPICRKPDWCSVSTDGTLAACRRVETGSLKTKQDKNGAPVYLHRLSESPPPLPAPPENKGQGPNRANPDTLHQVYSALLNRLSLSASHRENLSRRGLSDSEIEGRGYRTLFGQGRARLVRDLVERFGHSVLQVPGFVVRQRDGRRYVTLAGQSGLLVPVRDIAGRIIALKVRRDNPGDEQRYCYISSAKYGGPSSGAPVHVPAGVQAPAETVRVTEGELKADAAFVLSGLPTISVPGATTWRPCLHVLKGLACKTVRLAFDADAPEKPQVAQALAGCAKALAAEGFAIELEQWPKEHKGIDDFLAAGGTPEVLTGPEAMAAVRAIADGSGERQEAPKPVIERLRFALDGGPEALFRDADLLRDLAKLSLDDPAEHACCRAVCAGAKVKLRDLDRLLSPHRRELAPQKPPPDAADIYRVAGGRIVREVMTRDGMLEVPLANFAARIVQQTIIDDGAERRLTLAVEGALSDGTPLPRVEIGAEQFPWMKWPVEKWGSRATVLAGAGTADHLRVAMQLLSGDVPTMTVFAHLGWREIGGRWLYLHAGGAIGDEGAVEGINVAPPDALAGYLLPDPPGGIELVGAVGASLAIFNGLAPDRIVFPLVGAVYRALLASADFALKLAGPTGVYKTELAAVCQQHYGSGMDARHLPASWSSTGNALEGTAFAAKDALLTVDDFAPQGGAADMQRLHREADRLLRAQGNRSGRGRMRSDGTLRPNKPPRGMILSTGEDVPRGQSLRSRMLVIEVGTGDVDLARLTACQQDASAGRYAGSLAGFVKWLARRYATVQADLPQQRAGLRDKAVADGQHARTPGIVADLAIGLHYFFDFALEVGAIDADQCAVLARRGWQALEEAAELHAAHLTASEPCGMFIHLLTATIASGRAHVADPEGNVPMDAEAWGWRQVIIGTGQFSRSEWQPQGRRIGWTDGEALYLEPEAAVAEAQRLAGEQGESLPVSARTLWKRMKERRLLASWDDGRQRNTVRRSLEGARHREVIHLRADSVFNCAQPSTPSTSTADPPKKPKTVDGLVDGTVDGQTGQTGEPSTGTVHFPGENTPDGRCGRSAESTDIACDSRRMYALMPDGRALSVPSLNMVPAEATAWCWEGDPCWRPMNGQAQKCRPP
jgi:hypothetical protein